MINVEIIKVHAGQILPCGWVTGNKEFIIGGLILSFFTTIVYVYDMPYMENFAVGKTGKFGK